MNNTNFNLTDLERTISAIGYLQGVQVGNALIKNGSVPMNHTDTVYIIIENISKANYPKPLKILATMGSKEFCTGTNLGLAVTGVYIRGSSIHDYCLTKSPFAKSCYAGSAVCSGAATVSGTISAFSNYYGVSSIAMGGDTFGTAFLQLGHKARKAAEEAEGKKKFSLNPFRN